jgi:hypothetical protein
MRRKREFKPDAFGQYVRDLGWKRTGEGRPTQHKFRLGTDRSKAEIANLRLEQLWAIVEADYHERRANGAAADDRPVWNEVTLAIAQVIARGGSKFTLDRSDRYDKGDDTFYFHFVEMLAEKYASVIAIVPADPDGHMNGRLQELELAAKLEASAAEIRAKANGKPAAKIGSTLHEAMDAYIEWIKSEYRAPDAVNGETTLTPWGMAQTKNVERLKERHRDLALSAIDLAVCEEMFRLWRQRPKVKGRQGAIGPKTAQHHIKQLKRFFHWLHRAKQFEWRKPEDFEDIQTKIEVSVRERARRLSPFHVDSFSLEQVTLLNEYATPLERAFLLLGLNCGFNKGEIGTLVLGEIVLNQRHPYENVLGFHSLDTDSFIKRIRHKSGVYGEFLLWPQTVQAIQWAMENRKRGAVGHNGDEAVTVALPGPEALLFLTEDGHSYLTPTKTGNANQRIPNVFAALVRRVRRDHRDFPKLSFGKLRKTGANFVKRFSDGEVAATFLCHGQAVKVDDWLTFTPTGPLGRSSRPYVRSRSTWSRCSLPRPRTRFLKNVRRVASTFRWGWSGRCRPFGSKASRWM